MTEPMVATAIFLFIISQITANFYFNIIPPKERYNIIEYHLRAIIEWPLFLADMLIHCLNGDGRVIKSAAFLVTSIIVSLLSVKFVWLIAGYVYIEEAAMFIGCCYSIVALIVGFLIEVFFHDLTFDD